MTRLITYPFRLVPGGSVATEEDGSDAVYASELAVAVLTRQGEREQVPTFGVADPTFVGFDEAALRLHVEVFGPPVRIDRVETSFVDDTTEDVVVHYSPEVDDVGEP